MRQIYSSGKLIKEQLQLYSVEKKTTLPAASKRLKINNGYIFINGEKKELGKVFTPEKTVSFMVNRLGPLNNKIILEPCAGDGRFIKELINQGAHPNKIVAFDIDLNFSGFYRNLNVNFCISDFLLTDIKKLTFVTQFDYVIGNPPYLSRHSSYIQTNKTLLLNNFKEIGAIDTYTLFIYKGLSVLKEGGILCFITSDTFLTVEYHKKLREFILKNAKIKEIILPPKNLFLNQGVSVYPCIMVFQKCKDENERNKNTVNYIDRLVSENEYFFPKRIIKIPQKLFLAVQNYPISININDYTIKLLNYPIKITEVIDGHIGLHTHNNEKHIAAIEGSSLEIKFRQNNRKVISENLINSGQWKYYLKQGGDQKYWREITEAIDWSENAVKNYEIPKQNQFGKEGIVISGVSKNLCARYMPPGCFWDTNKAMGFIPKTKDISIYYLLGILNSKLYNYLLKGILNMTNCVQIDDIRRLPFIYPRSKIKSKIETLVINIIKKMKIDINYDYTIEQNEIDNLVFDLYGTPKDLRKYIIEKF